jgi:hypothetical protein
MLSAGAAGALGVLIAPEAVLAQDEVGNLRWDLVAVGGGAVVPAGTDVATDASSGDTISVTGSGFARPDEGTASGGGTSMHRHADGSEVAHGVYVVTGFNSFTNGGGSLAGTGLMDAIGRIDTTTGGVLSLNFRVAGAPVTGVLEIHCTLPGGRPDTEGIRVVVPQFGLDFKQTNGFTLFHALED